MIYRIALACGLAAALFCADLPAATFWGPTPYKQESDVPADFGCQLCDDCALVIETFEDDDATDLGFVIEGGRVIPPGFNSGLMNLTDSVDGDDGVVDGSGSLGYSWYNPANSVIVHLPAGVKAAGLVWTDGDIGSSAIFEAFDLDGNSLGQVGPDQFADDFFTGQTDEDRFYGVKNDAGLSRIVITNVGGLGIEIDHVMYEDCTACIPEPLAGLSITAVGLLGLLRRRTSA